MISAAPGLSRSDILLRQSRMAARAWIDIVRLLRPRLSWQDVADRVNAELGPERPIRPHELHAHCRRLVRAGDLPWAMLDRTMVSPRVLAVLEAQKLRLLYPEMPPEAIAAALADAGFHPPRASQWSAATVSGLLGEAADA